MQIGITSVVRTMSLSAPSKLAVTQTRCNTLHETPPVSTALDSGLTRYETPDAVFTSHLITPHREAAIEAILLIKSRGSRYLHSRSWRDQSINPPEPRWRTTFLVLSPSWVRVQ